VLRGLSLFGFLFAFWLLLSGRYDLGDRVDRYLTVCGFLVCASVTWLSLRRLNILDREGHPIQVAGRALRYVPWLFWQILLANWDVFKRVWHPKRPISPGFVRVPHDTRSDLGTVIYANSITLTPGTVTVSVDRDQRELLVHCLHEAAGQDLLAGGMLARVKQFEGAA
jgi:multicomponent Na+:H+ antiporter subunit E